MTDNIALLEALEDFLDAEGDEDETRDLLREFLAAFIGATLVVADDGELAYVKTKAGQIFLAVFTDDAQARAFAPRHSTRPMLASAALRLVARGDYSGLTLDPKGICFELSAEDVADFFDIDPN